MSQSPVDSAGSAAGFPYNPSWKRGSSVVTAAEDRGPTGVGRLIRRWGPYVGAGLAAGALSGLFGIGGGLIIVPLLVFFFQYTQKVAQGTSLVAIVIIALAGAVPYALHVQIDWLAALLVVVGGVGGSLIGAAIAHRLPETWLRLIFAAVVVVSAIRMVWGAAGSAAGAVVSPSQSLASAAAYAGAGLAMGILSALLGVGGGIILVPLLALLLGLAQPAAQGLSLIVMAPVSLVGALRNGRHGYTRVGPGIALGLGGAVVSPLAALVALHLPLKVLSYLFAALLVFTAAQLVYKVLKARRTPRPS